MSYLIFIFIRILYFYQFIIVFYVLSSWFPAIRSSKIGRIIGALAEPYLLIFKRIIPPLGMVDFSPIIALWVLNMAMTGLFRLI